MRILLATLAAMTISGCATGPAGPTLPHQLTFKLNEYTEGGGILPLTGRLELTIDRSGDARSACRRDILSDVERSGSLSHDQLVELVSRVQAWTSKEGSPAPAGNNHGLLVYGEKKAGWAKDAVLPPELQQLVDFLLTIPTTLHVETRRKGF
jgi:hypothetical protein